MCILGWAPQMMGWSDPSFTHARCEQLVLRRWPTAGGLSREGGE